MSPKTTQSSFNILPKWILSSYPQVSEMTFRGLEIWDLGILGKGAFRGCAERIQLRGLADGGGRWKRKTVEATVAREERAGRGGVESQLCGAAHRV